MYLPAHFEESRIEVLRALVDAHPLATVVTLTGGGLAADHVPLQWHETGAGRQGSLRGHVARANPIWQDRGEEVEALAVFQGPESYISPSWYPTKQEHGKVVPTWNYCCVHARGTLRFHHEPGWIRAQVEALTARREAAMPQPWSVADAPAHFIDAMLAQIVGIELVIDQLTGKWKVSQNQPAPNRAGAREGLARSGTAAGSAMAELIGRYPPG
jgi:transcriptional regulator